MPVHTTDRLLIARLYASSRRAPWPGRCTSNASGSCTRSTTPAQARPPCRLPRHPKNLSGLRRATVVHNLHRIAQKDSA
jgi:hypothetical protein